ncbi:MAG TPA: single-stranded DNA-binding protein [Anaerolineales bacterium]|nr:single-stranded DNA-binding protein [Anaerolineales bacterium]
MPALNRVQLIGYLGKDPESKYTPTGRRVTDFSIAITHRWKGDGGEAGVGVTREHTEWVQIEAWGRLAETCHEYLKKGSLAYVEGRLKTDRYEEKGETRYFTKVVAQSVQFLSDNKPEDGFVEQDNVTGEEQVELADASEV